MAWGQAYKSHLGKLRKLQKRALRFIYFSERNQHAIPLFIDAGVLPSKFLHYDLLANLMFEKKTQKCSWEHSRSLSRHF